MATTYSFTGYNYDGNLSNQWYSAWVLEGYTSARMTEMRSVMLNCKQPLNIPTITSGNAVKAASCNFSASGTTTVATKQLSTVRMAVMEEYCENTLEQTWLLELFTNGSNNSDFLPKEFADALLATKTEKIQEEIEEAIWQGDTGGATGTILDLMDGFLVKFDADADVIDVTFGASLSSANILSKLDDMIAAMPKKMKQRKGKPDFFIGIPVDAADMYISAITTGFTNPNAPTDNLIYKGYRLEVIPGLPSDVMVASSWMNLWLGTDIAGEQRDIRLISLKETTGDNVVRLKAEFRLGVEYAFGENVVYGKV